MEPRSPQSSAERADGMTVSRREFFVALRRLDPALWRRPTR
jgi:hypothetical protein